MHQQVGCQVREAPPHMQWHANGQAKAATGKYCGDLP